LLVIARKLHLLVAQAVDGVLQAATPTVAVAEVLLANATDAADKAILHVTAPLPAKVVKVDKAVTVAVSVAVVEVVAVARPAIHAAGSVICLVTALKAGLRNATTAANRAICLGTVHLRRATSASATCASNQDFFSPLALTRGP
jgi:hypothetical protein